MIYFSLFQFPKRDPNKRLRGTSVPGQLRSLKRVDFETHFSIRLSQHHREAARALRPKPPDAFMKEVV